jgi:CHAT domain-containing protein
MSTESEYLSDSDLHRLFKVYFGIAGREHIRTALEAEPRLRLPAFHDVLRNQILHLRSQQDAAEEDRTRFLLGFGDFFAHLHFEAYLAQVHKAAERVQPRQPTVVKTDEAELAQRVLSQADAPLVGVLWAERNGLLQALLSRWEEELPVVRRDRPLQTWSHICRIADSAFGTRWRRLSQHVNKRLEDGLPATRGSLSATILWHCLACDSRFSDLHRHFVDGSADAELQQMLRVGALNEHLCPHCQSPDLMPHSLLAIERTPGTDLLLAASCLYIAHPTVHVWMLPHLSQRDASVDSILESRLLYLSEMLCLYGILTLPQRGNSILLSNIAYSLEEFRSLARRMEQETQSHDTDEAAVRELAGEAFLETFVQRVEAGDVPLDAAAEYAEQLRDLSPEVPVPVGSWGNPSALLAGVAVAEAVMRDGGSHTRSAILAINLANLYSHVGALGPAWAALKRAQDASKRATESGENTDWLTGYLCGVQGILAMKQGRLVEAFRDLLRAAAAHAYTFLKNPSQSDVAMEAQINRLGDLNAAGMACLNLGRFGTALGLFRTVRLDSITQAAQVEGLRREQLDTSANGEMSSEDFDAFRKFLIHELRRLSSGATANYGLVLEQLAYACTEYAPRVQQICQEFGVSEEEFLKAMREAGPESPDSMLTDLFLVCCRVLGDISAWGTSLAERLLNMAATSLKEALDASEQIASHHFASIQAAALARLYHRMQRPLVQCCELASVAVGHAREAGSLATLAEHVELLSACKEKSGMLDQAAELADEALLLLIQRRVAGGLESMRRWQNRLVAPMALRSANLWHQLRELWRVVGALENAKSNLLTIELDRIAPSPDYMIPDEGDLAQLKSLEAQRERLLMGLPATEPQQTQARDLGATPGLSSAARSPAVHEQLKEIQRQIQEAREALALRHPRFEAWCRWTTVRAVPVRQLHTELDRAREAAAIVGYFLASDELWAYAVAQGELEVQRHPLGEAGVQRIIETVEELRTKLSNRELSDRAAEPLVQEVAREVTPILEWVYQRLPDGGTLVFAPHRALHNLPWPLIRVQDIPLIERFALHQVFGLGMLDSIWQRQHDPAGSRILVVADPLQGSGRELPQARQEAIAIERIYRSGTDCETLVGADATLEAVARRSVGCEVVHFACHGSFDGPDEQAGQLFLAPSRAASPDSGVLNCRKIVERLQLRGTRLVNLAACEAALVRDQEGTEVSGLARAFLCAGAGSVLASLWSLEDRNARVFSERFYWYFRTTSDPAEALRQTQVECLHGELGRVLAHPSNWASYVLLGAPTPEHDRSHQ